MVSYHTGRGVIWRFHSNRLCGGLVGGGTLIIYVILVLADIKIHKIWSWMYMKFMDFGVGVTVFVSYQA